MTTLQPPLEDLDDTPGLANPSGSRRDATRAAIDSEAPAGGQPRDARGIEIGLLEAWRMLLKHRRLILASAISTLGIGLIVTLVSTPIYRSATTMQIEREAAKVVDTHDSSQPPVVEDELAFYATQLQLLKSRALVERVVQTTGLAQDADFMSRESATPLYRFSHLFQRGRVAVARPPQGSLADREARAVALVRRGLNSEIVRGSHVFKITFDSPDPATSARIANAFADTFVQSNLDRRFEASDYARNFLENQLASEKEKLENSEKALVQYAQNQQIINIDDGKPLSNSTLETLTSALDAARGERIRAQTAWIQANARSGDTLPQVLSSNSIQELKTAQTKIQAEYEKGLTTYTAAYPPMRQLEAQIGEYDRRIHSEINDVKVSLQSQYQAALRQEHALETELDQAKKGALDLRARSIQYDTLQREVDTNRSLYDGLLQRYKEVGVAGGVGTNNISVIDSATVPERPYLPNWLLNLGVAGLLGLIIGVGAALIIEYLDETLKIPEEIPQRTHTPALGSTPELPRGLAPRDAVNDRLSPFAESYYAIRTALQFATSEGAPKSLLITSARSSEGKSTTAAVLARHFAQLGRRVLLIDADLRNPSLHTLFDCVAKPGLSNYLAGHARVDEVIGRTENPHLSFIHSGPPPPNPTDLLGGGRLPQLLADAERDFDMVIVDGPPVMGLGDATLLASATTGVLMVIEAGRTHVRLVNAALERLRLGRAHIIGAVLTKFNPRRSGYGQSYGYGYGDGHVGLAADRRSANTSSVRI